MISLEEVLELLQNVKRCGNRARASCPCKENHRHGDRNPSLSLTVGRNGAVIFNCLTGCDFRQVRNALQIRASAFYRNDKNDKFRRAYRMTMKLESTHSYIKPTGELVCEIHKYRFEDGRKEYFPRRPRPKPDRTGSVPSEWLCGTLEGWYHRDVRKTHLWRRSDVWDGFMVGHGLMASESLQAIPMGFGRFNPPTCNSYHHVKSEYDSELIDDLEWAYFDAVERIPYNVNLWHQKTLDGHPLICVEGEKEADFLTKLGYCATTTLGGSKNRWTPSEGTWLAGRRVITVEDNDDTGRDYADSAVVQAIRAGAKEVRMVQSQHYACYANGSDLSACALQSEDPAVFVKMVLANAGQSWLPKPAAKVEPTDPVRAFAQHTEKATS